MIDLHTHTIFSDGELLPSEQVRRAKVLGYEAIAITDHADYTNLETLLAAAKMARYLEQPCEITVIPGVELTHVPPEHIGPLAKNGEAARRRDRGRPRRDAGGAGRARHQRGGGRLQGRGRAGAPRLYHSGGSPDCRG